MRYVCMHWHAEPLESTVERGRWCPHCSVELHELLHSGLIRCGNCGGPLVHKEEKREVVDSPVGPLLMEKL